MTVLPPGLAGQSVEMGANPGAPWSNDDLANESGDTAAMLSSNPPSPPDDISNARKRDIAAAVAAIDLANFVIIVVDFTVFASQSVVAPVAQLVLSLFFVKVGIACAVFALAHSLGSHVALRLCADAMRRRRPREWELGGLALLSPVGL